MQTVENWRVYGLPESVRASKYPMAVNTYACTTEITTRTESLASCPMGTGHDQFLTGIVVQFDLTLSLKAWVEAQRYHFLDFVSSQSTIHRIMQMDIDNQCNSYVTTEAVENIERLVRRYKDDPSDENYRAVLYNIPAGFKYTARMTTNYRQLKTIYHQRRRHRLPEWHDICDWIEELPYSELITGRETE